MEAPQVSLASRTVLGMAHCRHTINNCWVNLWTYLTDKFERRGLALKWECSRRDSALTASKSSHHVTGQKSFFSLGLGLYLWGKMVVKGQIHFFPDRQSHLPEARTGEACPACGMTVLLFCIVNFCFLGLHMNFSRNVGDAVSGFLPIFAISNWTWSYTFNLLNEHLTENEKVN